jgi:hypothetical protein
MCGWTALQVAIPLKAMNPVGHDHQVLKDNFDTSLRIGHQRPFLAAQGTQSAQPQARWTTAILSKHRHNIRDGYSIVGGGGLWGTSLPSSPEDA